LDVELIAARPGNFVFLFAVGANRRVRHVFS